VHVPGHVGRSVPPESRNGRHQAVRGLWAKVVGCGTRERLITAMFLGGEGGKKAAGSASGTWDLEARHVCEAG